MKTYGSLSLAGGAVALLGLACGGSGDPRTGSGGNAVTIAVAPLDGSGIGVACFDLKVETDLGTFWDKGDPETSLLDDDNDTICSDDHGNGEGGSVRWVGACDAQEDADTSDAEGVQNTVTIWFDGVYNEDKTETSSNVYDPCGAAGCSIDFDCDPNADTRADFNFTVIRDAQVGFFDIAVRFDNIYCSAKYDDCYTDNTPVQLFSGEDGPHKTGVFALSCTGPAGTDVDLHYGNLAVVCQGVSYPIDPTVDRATEADAEPSGTPLTYNAYRDTTSFACEGGTCNGLYWNLAFDLTDLPDLGACTLEFSATATNGEGVFVSGLPANSGTAYPYIDVDVTLSGGEESCQFNPLNGEESGVLTGYHGDLTNNPVAMCFSYNGTVTAFTGHEDCSLVPAAPQGNVLRAYTGICNDPDSGNGDWHQVDNPIECPEGTRCIMAGSYYYGTCIPDEVETCRENTGCGAATVELVFSRASSGNAGTISSGTIISSATDADGDSGTGYQYNFELLEDVEFLTTTTSAIGHAVLLRDPNMDPDDLGNVSGGTLTVIGQNGSAWEIFDNSITVTNENDASGGANDKVCVIGYGTQIGTCVDKGHPQACDPENSDTHCPAGSYCERGDTTEAGQCRAQAEEGAACSGSMASDGIEQCQPGLLCAFDPAVNNWIFACRQPGQVGDQCDADMDTNYPFCGPGLYCRMESEDFATCSPRKAVGEICSLPDNGDGRRYLGNCNEDLTCSLTFANPNNEDERRCTANPLLDHGEPCWIQGEESLRKCKGHCNIDVSPNPFANLQADGVCAADVGEGAPCHAGQFDQVDYNGYCRRGLYCNELGLGQMSGYGTCLPTDEIGSICRLEGGFPDAMCADDQLCGARNGTQGFMNGQEGYCVDRGCGNNVAEPYIGIEAEGEFGILVIWAGQCSTTTSTYCNVDGDCPGGETCTQNGPHDVWDWNGPFGPIGVDTNGSVPHGLQVGDEVKVRFEGAPAPDDGWQVRMVSAVINAWTIEISGSIPAGSEEVEVLSMDAEQCDDGRNNCDTVVNGQHACQCSTLCTQN
jgi:hypothetical protein